MIYKFRSGSFLKGDAQVVGERLTQIRKTRGQLTPHDVVQEASRESSVLHPYFEWDNDKAAYEYRLQQARHLVACVLISESNDIELKKPMRAFVNITTEAESSYENVVEVMGNAELRDKVLAQLENEIGRQQEKLQAFQELAEVVTELGHVREVVQKHRRQAPARHGVAVAA